MKKYLLLLSLGIATVATDSSAMFTHVAKRITTKKHSQKQQKSITSNTYQEELSKKESALTKTLKSIEDDRRTLTSIITQLFEMRHIYPKPSNVLDAFLKKNIYIQNDDILSPQYIFVGLENFFDNEFNNNCLYQGPEYAWGDITRQMIEHVHWKCDKGKEEKINKIYQPTEDSLSAALELNYTVKHLQSIVPQKEDPYCQNCGHNSPWDFYRTPYIDRSDIKSWIEGIAGRYNMMNDRAHDIDTIIPRLPYWSDKDHKIEQNTMIKQWINYNLQLLTEYHNFLLEHRERLNAEKKYKKTYLEFFQNYLGLSVNTKQKLQATSQSFKDKLTHHNVHILNSLHAIDCKLANEFYHHQNDQKNRE